jgi:hypothetical protein
MASPERENPIFDRALAASHLANGDTPFVHWEAPPHTRASLKYRAGVIGGREERFYDLDEVIFTGQPRVEAKRYVFSAEDGQLFGVILSELETDASGRVINSKEFESAMESQVKNNLTAPQPDDELRLDRILESGLDNPTLTEAPPQ